MRPNKRARRVVATHVLEADQPDAAIEGYGEEAFGRGETEINVVTKDPGKQKPDEIEFGKEATLIIGQASTLSAHLLMMFDFLADMPPMNRA